MLDKLRSATPATGAACAGSTVVNVLPIAAGTYLSKQAIDVLTATGQLPADAVITLLEDAVLEPPKLGSAVSQLDHDDDRVVQLHPGPIIEQPLRPVDEPEEIARLRSELEALSYEALLQRARDAGFRE